MPPRTRLIAQRLYDAVHIALWGLLAAWVAALIASIPHIREAHALADLRQEEAIAAESRFYCEKWGLRAGTHEHTICTLDLQKIRDGVERRLDAESDF